MNRLQHLAIDRPGDVTRSNPSQSRADELALDRDDPRRLLRMRRPCRGAATTDARATRARTAIGVRYRSSCRFLPLRPRWWARAPPGCTRRVCAAREGARVTLVSATPLAESSSWWAQGGLAAAVSADDSPELHLRDTIAAGRGAVRESAARVLCDEAPGGGRGPRPARRPLRRRPQRASRARPRGRSLARGGSSTPAGRPPAGGWCGSSARWSAEDPADRRARGPARGRADRRPAIAASAFASTTDASSPARAVVLATGGAAALWSRTTNPAGAVGGGLLLAHAAGATLADLELMQFHPTAVVGTNGADGFLVTEAVRGEGRAAARRQRASGSSTSSPRATRSRARSSARWRDRRLVGRPRHARRRPGAVPERGQRAAPGRESIPSAS